MTDNPQKYEHAEVVKESLRAQIAKLRSELEILESSLSGLERATSSGMRFAKCEGPMDAVRLMLTEDGPQKIPAIIQALVQGGGVIGRKRPRAEIMKGINLGLKKGLFVEAPDGRLDIRKRS